MNTEMPSSIFLTASFSFVGRSCAATGRNESCCPYPLSCLQRPSEPRDIRSHWPQSPPEWLHFRTHRVLLLGCLSPFLRLGLRQFVACFFSILSCVATFLSLLKCAVHPMHWCGEGVTDLFQYSRVHWGMHEKYKRHSWGCAALTWKCDRSNENNVDICQKC